MYAQPQSQVYLLAKKLTVDHFWDREYAQFKFLQDAIRELYLLNDDQAQLYIDKNHSDLKQKVDFANSALNKHINHVCLVEKNDSFKTKEIERQNKIYFDLMQQFQVEKQKVIESLEAKETEEKDQPLAEEDNESYGSEEEDSDCDDIEFGDDQVWGKVWDKVNEGTVQDIVQIETKQEQEQQEQQYQQQEQKQGIVQGIVQVETKQEQEQQEQQYYQQEKQGIETKRNSNEWLLPEQIWQQTDKVVAVQDSNENRVKWGKNRLMNLLYYEQNQNDWLNWKLDSNDCSSMRETPEIQVSKSLRSSMETRQSISDSIVNSLSSSSSSSSSVSKQTSGISISWINDSSATTIRPRSDMSLDCMMPSSRLKIWTSSRESKCWQQQFFNLTMCQMRTAPNPRSAYKCELVSTSMQRSASKWELPIFLKTTENSYILLMFLKLTILHTKQNMILASYSPETQQLVGGAMSNCCRRSFAGNWNWLVRLQKAFLTRRGS